MFCRARGQVGSKDRQRDAEDRERRRPRRQGPAEEQAGPRKEVPASRYLFGHPVGDGILFKNVLTRQIRLLSEEEWAALRAADLSCPGIEELAKLHYLVEERCDELAQYEMVLAVLKTIQNQGKGITSYTVLPTSGCNARCVYCHEEGWEPCHMTDEPADRLVDFICETKCAGRIGISWFGGESRGPAVYLEGDKVMRFAEKIGVRSSQRSRISLLKTGYCMADSGSSSVVDPQGGLHLCEHTCFEEPFASIFDGGSPKLPRFIPPIAPVCADCAFLPECTPFRKTGCPVKNSGCLTQMKLKSAHEVVAVRRRVEAARKKAAAEGADVERAAAAVENACPEYEETSS